MRPVRVLSAVVVLALASPAFAWSDAAHRVAADIATANLTPAAAAAVKKLLDGRTLRDVAADPDKWRLTKPESRAWHFVAIPDDKKTYDERRDCPTGDCLTGAVRRFTRLLADRSAPNASRTEALIYLTHFVADAHQPLHVAGGLGGNDVNVTFQGTRMNLHAYWDSYIITSSGRTEPQWSQALVADARSNKELQAAANRGDIESWVNESHALVRSLYPKGDTLDSAYIAASRKTTERQLELAGLRLAVLLNRILGAKS